MINSHSGESLILLIKRIEQWTTGIIWIIINVSVSPRKQTSSLLQSQSKFEFFWWILNGVVAVFYVELHHYWIWKTRLLTLARLVYRVIWLRNVNVSIAKVRMDIWPSLTYVCLTTDWYKHNVWTRTLGRWNINCFIFIHPLLDQPYLQSLFISLLNAKRSVFSQIEPIVVLSSAQSSCYIGMIVCSWKMLLGFNTIIKCRRLGWM